MKNDMWGLRLSMIKAGLIDTRDLRRIRWLSKGMHEQRQEIITALGANHPLLSRVIKCGEIDGHNNIRYCRVAPCPRCLMRGRGEQTRDAIRERFAGVPNEQFAFATILLPVTTDISTLSALIDTEKRRLVNFVARQRRLSTRWDDFEILGFWEIDRMSFGDYQNAGRNTKLALDGLGFPPMEAENQTVWRPHLHAIIRIGEAGINEIASALRADGHGAPYQVDIQPFDTNRPVNRNLQSTVRYSMKFRVEANYKGDEDHAGSASAWDAELPRRWWPEADIKRFAEWVNMERSGFQSLRFVLGRKREGNSPTGDGLASSNSMMDDRCHIREDQGIDGTNTESDGFAVDAMRSCSEGYGAVSRVRNNNVILDTNWTDMEAPIDFPSLSCKGDISPFDAGTSGEASRHPRNVFNLAERLRSMGLLERGSGTQRGNAAYRKVR